MNAYWERLEFCFGYSTQIEFWYPNWNLCPWPNTNPQRACRDAAPVVWSNIYIVFIKLLGLRRDRKSFKVFWATFCKFWISIVDFVSHFPMIFSHKSFQSKSVCSFTLFYFNLVIVFSLVITKLSPLKGEYLVCVIQLCTPITLSRRALRGAWKCSPLQIGISCGIGFLTMESLALASS